MVKAFPSSTGTSGDEKRTYEFHIAGVPYRLKTEHDEATVQELVKFLNDRIEQALKISRNGSFQNAAVLAALNIAEELLILKKQAHVQLQAIEGEIEKIAIELESSTHSTPTSTETSDQPTPDQSSSAQF